MLINNDDLNRANTAPLIGQARRHSLFEAVGGTAIGFVISYAVLLVITPIFNLRTNAGENFLITCIFTVTSVLRAYYWRRFCNWLHVRKTRV